MGLLYRQSKYFGKLIDEENSLDKQLVINIEDSDLTHFRDFFHWLYRNELPEVEDIDRLTALWELGVHLNARCFRNHIVDCCKDRTFDGDFVEAYYYLECNGFRDSTITRYMCRKVAYEIVSEGWIKFIETAGVVWKDIITDSAKGDKTMKDLLVQIDILTKQERAGELIDPAKVKDCEFHDHHVEDGRGFRRCQNDTAP